MVLTWRAIVTLLLTLLPAPLYAADGQLIRLDTRPGVTVPFFYIKRADATATVVLLPGGAGVIGMKEGVPTSRNFLVRSRDHFAASRFNVAVVGKPSDMSELDYAARISPEHMEDLRRLTAHLKKETRLPVWLVGTSRGSVSAAAAAIAFGNEELAGIVLTSSVTAAKKTGAVPYQNLAAIRIPVLVMHHERDECRVCVPGDAPEIIRGLENAPIRKLIYVSGGNKPQGDPCEALHWHGYIGMEKEAVDIISDWIRQPTN